ncbi:MAG TPA: hypothetical protein VI603_10900 [Saprospiraceae bacterium]|nr:hypothetical protein [Saprospiraceae bacterium]
MIVNVKKISNEAMIIVFLALIRIIGEFFRLEYTLKEKLTTELLYPFMLGALVCAISCLIMTICSFYAKHRIIIGIATLTIVILVVLKVKYIL